MNSLSPGCVTEPETPLDGGMTVRLSDAAIGDRGTIVEVRAELDGKDHGVDVAELQRRLLEFGFVEGARIEVIHEGAIGHDPIAVRLLREHSPSATLYIFSDDIETVACEFKPPGPHEFVRCVKPWHAYDKIRLMALCDHLAIANSTF